MSGYEITVSVTALCPCCGKELPFGSYLTESRVTGHPLDRDNPYERKDRRVFITPCADCFGPRAAVAELIAADHAYNKANRAWEDARFSGWEGISDESRLKIAEAFEAAAVRRADALARVGGAS